jgi:peptide/nickel transport system substrate-binding protein
MKNDNQNNDNQNEKNSEVYRLSRRRLIAGAAGLVVMGAVGETAAGASTASTLGKTELGKAFANAATTNGNILVVDVQTEPQGYCPLQYPNAASVWISGNVMDTLNWYDDDGKLNPLLATSITSTDGATWTVKLKQGVLFHNGDAFNADHVVATLLATMKAPTNVYNTQLGNISSATAVDANTVSFTLAAPNYLIPHVLATVPMCHKDHITDQTGIIGTGPFMWGKWTNGSNLTLTANSKYHLGAPPLAGVMFQFVPSADSRVVDALTGVSHISLLPSFSAISSLKANTNLNLIDSPAVVMLPLHINVNSDAFKDVRVRQALGFAMDRTRVRDIAFAGRADIFQGGVIPPVLSGFDSKNLYYPAKANITKAKALLKAAGKKKVEFTATVYAVPNAINAMTVIQQDIAKAGFICHIEVLPLAQWAGVLTSHKFDMCVSYEFNGTNWAKDGINQLANYKSGLFTNWVNYNDPKFDALIDASRATNDPAKQIALWKQADKMLTIAAVNLIPVVPHLTGAMSTLVHGLPTAPLRLDQLRLHNVSLR